MSRRTKSELLLMFANNTTADITPEDLRDFVDSCVPSHASLYLTSALPTTIPIAGTFYKAAGLTQLSDQTQHLDFSMPDHNRLMWTGIGTVHVNARAVISLTSVGSAVDVSVKIAKNGVVLEHSLSTVTVVSGSNKHHISVEGDCVLNSGDYLEVFVTNETDTSTVTFESLYFTVNSYLE